jgi:hypothetical protein
MMTISEKLNRVKEIEYLELFFVKWITSYIS